MELRGKGRSWWASHAVFLVVVGLGALGLAEALTVAVAVAGAGLAVLSAWPKAWWRLDLVAVRFLGAAIVVALALVGVNVVVDAAGLGRPPIALGMGLALIVFFLAAGWYLSVADWSPTPTCRPTLTLTWTVALVLALVAVVGAPILVGLGERDSTTVPTAERVRSKLDSHRYQRPASRPPTGSAVRRFTTWL